MAYLEFSLSLVLQYFIFYSPVTAHKKQKPYLCIFMQYYAIIVIYLPEGKDRRNRRSFKNYIVRICTNSATTNVTYIAHTHHHLKPDIPNIHKKLIIVFRYQYCIKNCSGKGKYSQSPTQPF